MRLFAVLDSVAVVVGIVALFACQRFVSFAAGSEHAEIVHE